MAEVAPQRVVATACAAHDKHKGKGRFTRTARGDCGPATDAERRARLSIAPTNQTAFPPKPKRPAGIQRGALN